MHKSLYWSPLAAPRGRSLRRLAAWALRRASVLLAAVARRLRTIDAPAHHEPLLEFYAEAGAPEGALYVDGQRVGTLPGVTRL